MNKEILSIINSNPYLRRYLNEHSYWYKELIRNPNSLKEMETKMKETYKLTFFDKINNLNDKVELIRTFIDVLN